MTSLRTILTCLGRTGAEFSIVKDLFGYHDLSGKAYVPAPDPSASPPNFEKVSLLEQVRLMEGKHLNVNVIRVGGESFTDSDFRTICFALQSMRFVFGKVGLGVGRVDWFLIDEDDAGTLVSPANRSEIRELTNSWSTTNDGLDLFVVRTMFLAGRTGPPHDNTCNKDRSGKQQTGSVARLRLSSTTPDTDVFVGNTFAHEIGHYLGLDHVSDPDNFIGGDGGSDAATGITQAQGTTMKQHCFVRDGC